jgi:hypothetical protein
MLSYDKAEVRNYLTLENIFELLVDWGAEPEYANFGIVCATICHNPPGEGSRKLYFYENSGLFNCYTGCNGTFDIFELTIKVFNIQNNRVIDLNEAVRWIAYHFGINPTYVENDTEKLEDWDIFDNYTKLQNVDFQRKNLILPEYDDIILSRLNYKVRLEPWLKENISQSTLNNAKIGFFPSTDQITIPHFDQEGRFIGLRGRTLSEEDASRYGKYRPLIINQKLYNHPLGMNLYNLNNSKENIKVLGKAIVFESEKSVLKYQSYFGIENDISVACCGSNISDYQIQLLIDAGAKEIVIAFDRQFQNIGDTEYKHLVTNLKKIHKKYNNIVTISFIFDKFKITGYKSSPIDEGVDKFMKLFKERVFL